MFVGFRIFILNYQEYFELDAHGIQVREFDCKIWFVKWASLVTEWNKSELYNLIENPHEFTYPSDCKSHWVYYSWESRLEILEQLWIFTQTTFQDYETTELETFKH